MSTRRLCFFTCCGLAGAALGFSEPLYATVWAAAAMVLTGMGDIR